MQRVTAPERAARSDATAATTVRARFEYPGKPATEAGASLVRRARRERITRAALGWAACWGLAILAVFIPLLHFILVPLLLLAGPLVGRSRWLEKATVLGARGVCPGCGQPQSLELRQPARESIPLRCPGCGRPLSLRIDPALFESASTSPSPGDPA